MTTPIRLTPFLLIACGALGAGHPAAASAGPKGEPVPFETLAVVSDTSGINLGDHQILRLARNEDIDAVGELLAEDYGSPLADEVMAAVDEVPSGAVVLIGVIDVSCTPATEAGLVRLDAGELVMFAPGHVPEPIECFVANTTVAVLAVDADDAPPGSADGAQLVEFSYIGVQNPGDISAVELTDDLSALATILPADAEIPVLPASVAGMRRLAFVRAGCQFASAELWATRTTLTAHFEQEDPDVVINCGQAEYFLAVFDVPVEAVPPDAELDGSIVS